MLSGKVEYKILKSILAVLSLVIVTFAMNLIKKPFLIWMMCAFWISFWIYNILNKIIYRRNRSQNQVRLPTQNDGYLKLTSILLGIFCLAGSIIWIILEGQISSFQY